MAYTLFTDFVTTGEFIKHYGKRYKSGEIRAISKNTLLAIIEKEKTNPGTTGLDVIEAGRTHLVKFSRPAALQPLQQDISTPEGKSVKRKGDKATTARTTAQILKDIQSL